MNKNLLNYFNGDDFSAGIWKSKYADKGEITPDDMHKRMAKEFARIEINYSSGESNSRIKLLSFYGRNRQFLTEEKIYNLFKDFKYIIPQGRVMAGLGVKESYRSLSNCLRLPPPKDSYSSIMYTDTMLISSAKRGCGYGLGLSNLRPEDTFVSNAANTSTGAASFMSRYSNSTREVAQKGRRGACLLDMEIFHPDVLQFITAKVDRTKVTGANISVKLYNEFMEAVEKDEDFTLRFPCEMDVSKIQYTENYPYDELDSYKSHTGQEGFVKRIKAKKYWDIIVDNAWENAEPGLFFWDRVINYDPSSVYSKYFIDGTNACGEQPMAVYDTCRLILLNLYSFVKNPFSENSEVDLDLVYKMAYEQMRLGDDLVDLEIEYIDRIIDKINSDDIPNKEKAIELSLWVNVKDIAQSGRRVGAGITALADMVAACGFAYDSNEGLNLVAEVMNTKMRAELDATIDLAILRGTFQGWDTNKEFVGVNIGVGCNDFYQMILDEFPEQARKMSAFGRRNVNWNTIAPAGSTSIVGKTKRFSNLSSGCEPQFSCFYFRKKKINPDDKDVRVDFVDQNGDSWMEYPVIMGAFKEWILYTESLLAPEQRSCTNFGFEDTHREIIEQYYKESPWYNSTANDIDWKKRIQMQSILQKYTTSAISSTLNLPKDVTKETVSEIYFEGWKQGLKGITIYRDGCRTGVLSTEASKDQFEQKDAVKRPKELEAKTHYSTSKGEHYHIIIGFLSGKPYEIFIDDSDNKYSSEGIIVKEGRGNYVFKNGGDPINIRAFMNDEQEAITRLVSANLRHGTDIKFVVEQLQKTPGDMFSFTKSLGRVLKKYIPDGSKASGKVCQECGSDAVIFQEGCETCQNCGSSKCS